MALVYFNMKKLASDAKEKLSQSEKTEMDAHFENLLAWAGSTKNWTEKIYNPTKVWVQQNPNARLEEILYENLD